MLGTGLAGCDDPPLYLLSLSWISLRYPLDTSLQAPAKPAAWRARIHGHYGSTEEVPPVASVYRQQGETIEQLIRRFKKTVQQDGILTVVRRKRYYEKPSQARKRQAARKLRKSQKTTLRDLRRRF